MKGFEEKQRREKGIKYAILFTNVIITYYIATNYNTYISIWNPLVHLIIGYSVELKVREI